MIWNSAADFWAMGGYGLYVWGSMGMTFGLMALEMLWVKQERSQALKQVALEIEATQTPAKEWQS